MAHLLWIHYSTFHEIQGPGCITLTINGNFAFNGNFHRILDADWLWCLVAIMVVTIESKVIINGKFYATGPWSYLVRYGTVSSSNADITRTWTMSNTTVQWNATLVRYNWSFEHYGYSSLNDIIVHKLSSKFGEKCSTVTVNLYKKTFGWRSSNINLLMVDWETNKFHCNMISYTFEISVIMILLQKQHCYDNHQYHHYIIININIVEVLWYISVFTWLYHWTNVGRLQFFWEWTSRHP